MHCHQQTIGWGPCKNIHQNIEELTKKEIAIDKLYTKSQGIIGRTSERYFKSMASNNMIQNCHITDSDVTNDHTMFSPNLYSTRVNKVQQNPDRVVMYYVSVPREFLKLYKFVTLVADMIFMNVTPLLITISYGIYVVTVQHFPILTAKKLSKSLKELRENIPELALQ